jgi:hypothetical protein
MKKNLGTADRLIRVMIAGVIAVLYFTDVIIGTPGLILLIFGGVFLATSLISFCPIYGILGIRTCEVKNTDAAV